jgi:hypothetical protein
MHMRYTHLRRLTFIVIYIYTYICMYLKMHCRFFRSKTISYIYTETKCDVENSLKISFRGRPLFFKVHKIWLVNDKCWPLRKIWKYNSMYLKTKYVQRMTFKLWQCLTKWPFAREERFRLSILLLITGEFIIWWIEKCVSQLF